MTEHRKDKFMVAMLRLPNFFFFSIFFSFFLINFVKNCTLVLPLVHYYDIV